MSNTVSSSNMNLPVPVVGVDPGPQWGTDLNSCLTLIDQHNHAAGSGVQINPSGLNINTDLPMGSNNLTLVRSIRFAPQGAVLSLVNDVGCAYVSGVDFYFNDGNGNKIRLTQSGSITGATGSITGLVSPASASYVSANQTFVWQSAANTPANLDCASILLRNLTTGSNALTLSPPAAMGSNYSITLPTLPSSTSFMTLSSGGIIANYSAAATSVLGRASNTSGVLADIVASTDVTALVRTGSALAFSKMAWDYLSPTAAAKTANYTTTITDNYIKLTATGGAFTITLHTPTYNQKMVLQRTDNTPANAITITGTIDGESDWLLYTKETVELLYSTTDSEWKALAHNTRNAQVSAGTITITAVTTNPTKGAIVKDEVVWNRDGQHAIITYKLAFSGTGAAGSGDYLYALPTGLVADTTETPVDTGADGAAIAAKIVTTYQGKFYTNTGPATNAHSPAVMYTSTTFRIYTTAIGSGVFHGSGQIPFSQIIGLRFTIRLKIAGWKA